MYKGLFENWLEIEKQSGSQVDAINRLNAACGTKYKKEWPQVMKKRGYSMERVPTEVRRYMMRLVIPTLIDVRDDELDSLIKNLT